MGYKKVLVILPVCLISYSAIAGKWTLTPSIEVTETYTDNLLRTQQSKKSTWITELTPALKVLGLGKHLDASLIYKLANINYHSFSEADDSSDYYKGNLNFKLLNDQWLINLSADKGRSINSLADGISSNTNLTTPLQTDTSHYSFGTSFNSTIPDVLIYKLNFQANKVEGQDDRKFNNKKATSSSIALQNTNQKKRSYWNLSAQNNEIIDDQDDNFERQVFRQYSGDMGFNFVEDYWIFLQYYQQDNDLGSGSSSSLESSSYGVGLRWFPSNKIDLKISYNKSLDDLNSDFASIELTVKPSNRTQLYLTTGQRFYGDYYDLLFNYNLRHFSATISYREEITSYNLDLFRSPTLGSLICPDVEGSININDCEFATSANPVIEPGKKLIQFNILPPDENQQTYLDKRLSATVSYTKRKLNLIASYSRSIKSDLETQSERHENFIELIAGYRLNSRSDISINASFRDSTIDDNLPTESTTKDRVLSVDYSRRLSRKAMGSISVARHQRRATGSLQSYDENRISISLIQEF